MNGKRVFSALATLAALYSPCSIQAWAAGVEIGNAMIKYDGAGVQIIYPKSWNMFDRGAELTVAEDPGIEKRHSAVDISEQKAERILTEADLRGFVEKQHPGAHWEAVVVDGRPAFQDLDKTEGAIYVLREPKRVVTILFHRRDTDTSRKQTDGIIQSVRFLEKD